MIKYELISSSKSAKLCILSHHIQFSSHQLTFLWTISNRACFTSGQNPTKTIKVFPLTFKAKGKGQKRKVSSSSCKDEENKINVTKVTDKLCSKNLYNPLRNNISILTKNKKGGNRLSFHRKATFHHRLHYPATKQSTINTRTQRNKIKSSFIQTSNLPLFPPHQEAIPPPQTKSQPQTSPCPSNARPPSTLIAVNRTPRANGTAQVHVPSLVVADVIEQVRQIRVHDRCPAGV